MYSRKIALAAVSAVVLAVGTGTGFAQTSFGAMVGVVRDATGAIVPSAVIAARNTATGVVYNGKSSASGEFRISYLPYGNYDLTTSAPGFSTASVKGIGITGNNVQTSDVVLSAAGTSTTVEVTSQSSVSIDTTTAQIQSTFSAIETADLPTATVDGTGLGAYNLSLLAPGVASTGGLGAGSGPSVSGQRPRNNNFMIDGVDNNNKSVTGPLFSIPNDAVAEFTSLQNVYSAQYGHSTGGQFNEIIVAGTNSVHGRLYEYFENRNLNANSATQGALDISNGVSTHFQPRFDYNRYGGQLGGPIIKDRLFAFTNYERQEIGQSGTGGYCSPTAAGFATLGAQTFGPSAGVTTTSNLATFAQYSLPAATQSIGQDNYCFLPTPATAANPGTIAVTNRAGATVNIPVGPVGFNTPLYRNLTFSTSSLDWTISQNDSLHFRYAYNRGDGTDTAASFTAFYGPEPLRIHVASIDEVHTFTSNLSNDFRIGFNRYFNQDPVPANAFPGLAAFPNLNFDDLETDLGPDPNGPQATVSNLYQAVETLLWVKGKHTIAVGGEGRKYIAPELFVQRVRGDYDYASLSQYLNDGVPSGSLFGIPGGSSRNATPPGVSPTFYGDQTSIYAYANDDWRVTPTLTLNLGLRYEFTSIPASSKLQSLNSASSVAGLINFAQPTSQKKNFAPRVGVAYAPDANTSIRAGFGINYDVIYDNIGTTTAPPQFQITETVAGNTPATATTVGFLAAGGLPANTTFGTPGLATTIAAQKAATSSFVPNQRVPYSEQWTLGIQHVFHKDYTAEIRYVGTRGVHLDVQDQIDVQSPVTTQNQLPTVGAGTTVAQNGTSTLAFLRTANANGAPYYRVPAYYAAGFTSTITSDLPIGGSNYNGLQTQLTRRFQKGLLVNASYTFSRNMDDSTADFNTTALNPRRPQDAQNIRSEYAVSDLDRRHRLTLVAVYDFNPFKTGFLHNITDLEIDPSYTFQSPQLTTVQSGIDSNLNNDSAGDRVFVNPNGIKGTGTGVVALVNPGISCVGQAQTSGFTAGIANGTSAVITACNANIIGYTPGTLVAHTGAATTFTPNTTAYYIQGGPGTSPTSARNSLATGRTNNFDLSAYKRFGFRDRYKVEFGAQATNVLNHSQFLPGSASLGDSITSTAATTGSFDKVANPAFNIKQKAFNNNARTLQLSGKLIF